MVESSGTDIPPSQIRERFRLCGSSTHSTILELGNDVEASVLAWRRLDLESVLIKGGITNWVAKGRERSRGNL
jgi:hypothetical protein